MTIKTKRRLSIFLAFYAIVLVVEGLSSYFTQLSVTNWYTTLTKSPLTPPGAVFGITWTALYLLMAIAAERIYHRTGTVRCHAIRWWFIQLLLGLLWCIVFFGQRDVATGFVVISATWLAALFTLALFRRVDAGAAWLMLPLMLWLSFASYLNLYIVLHN